MKIVVKEINQGAGSPASRQTDAMYQHHQVQTLNDCLGYESIVALRSYWSCLNWSVERVCCTFVNWAQETSALILSQNHPKSHGKKAILTVNVGLPV